MTRQKTAVWLALAAFALGGLAAYLILRKPAGVDPAPVGGTPEPLPVLGMVPEFSLTDADGGTVGLKELLGRAWVANFMFTRCGETCPAQSRNLAELQAKIGEAPLANQVRLVSITLDPDHDTPKVLTEYAARHKARAGFWHFLSGAADDVVWLSRKGFKLPAERPKGKAAPTHSQQFALVDPWGQIRGYYDGTSATAMEKLRGDLELAAVEAAPTADPIAESAALRDPRQKLEPELRDPSWLRGRQKEQLAAAKGWAVFHDFGFADQLDNTGITFRHRVVDDASNLYKPVHYDHGNGLVAADVDGDGLIDLYFVNQVGPCQLWRNKGGGKFEDITAKAGVGLAEPIKVTAAFVDVNNDGAPDLYVTTVRGGNRLFLNDGKGVFEDATEGSGLGLVGHFSSPVFFDYDRDGFVDLFLCDVGVFTTDTLLPVTPFGPAAEKDAAKYQYYEAHKDAFSGHLKPERFGTCRMLRNRGGGKFADVTKELGLEYTGWTGDATPIDANGDGWPDLYVLNMQGGNEYYENDGGRRFVKSRAVFPKTPWGAMGAKVFDFDNDGKFDLYVTDMHSDMSIGVGPTVADEKRKSKVIWPESFLLTKGASVFGNALFQARGKGEFAEVSDEKGAETFWPWGPSVGDLNADGFQDVFVTAGMGYPYRYGINSLLLNDGGTRFRDTEFVLGVEPRRGWRTALPWFERKGNPSRPLVEWGSLSTRSAILLDLDDDGDLDIVTSEFGAEPMVLVSNLSERKKVRFLKVRLVGGMTADGKAGAGQPGPGAKSNRDGLGAVVRVRCGSRNFIQCHDGRSGYLSQGLLPLYFGLGEADAIDEIEVTWPSGKKQTLPGPVKANEWLTIREGE